jgi:hypothetical protein
MDKVVRVTRTGQVQLRKERSDAFTQDRQDAFFARLADTCNVTEAARHVGATRQTVWKWRRKDKEFAQRYAMVLADAYADLQMRLIAMVRDGVTGEQWEETGADGVVRLRYRRDTPGQIRMLLQQHQAAQSAAEPPAEAARAARETLDELIQRLRDRMAEIEAEEAGKDGTMQ